MKKSNYLEKHLYRTVSYRIDFSLPSYDLVRKVHSFGNKLIKNNSVEFEYHNIGPGWDYIKFTGDNELQVKDLSIKLINYLKKFKDVRILEA